MCTPPGIPGLYPPYVYTLLVYLGTYLYVYTPPGIPGTYTLCTLLLVYPDITRFTVG